MIPKKEKYAAVIWNIGTAVTLTVLKAGVGLFTGSMALFASALDSLMDVLVSSVNLISLKEADKPADEEHLYGHGKIESLAGLFQSLVISASGLYLVVESIRRIVTGSEVRHIPAAIGVMIISILLTAVLIWRLRRIGKQTQSIIIKTEALHFTMDFLANAGVIAALLLVAWTGSELWDVAIALGIAAYILKEAFSILKTSVNELIDRALPPEEQSKIEELIMNFDPKIIGFHELRTRRIGEKIFIDFHVEIRGEENFRRAHDLTEALMLHIKSAMPNADVTIHYDPEGAE